MKDWLFETEAVLKSRALRIPDELERSLARACYRSFGMIAVAASILEDSLLFAGATMLIGVVASLVIDRRLAPPLQRNAIAFLSLVVLFPITISTCSMVAGTVDENAGEVLLALMLRSLVVFGTLLFLGHKQLLEFRALLLLGVLGMLLTIASGSDRRLTFCVLLYIVFTVHALVLYSRWRDHHKHEEREEKIGLGYRVWLGRGCRASSFSFGPAVKLSGYVLLVAGALFLCFPKQSSRASRRPAHTSEESRTASTGFTERMSLGSAGILKQNWEPALIIRDVHEGVRPLAQVLGGATPYWRGMAYAHYRDHAWEAEPPLGAPRVINGGSGDLDLKTDGWITFQRGAHDTRTHVELDIEVRLAQSRLLFGLDRTDAISAHIENLQGELIDGYLRRGRDDNHWFTDETGRGLVTEGTRYRVRAVPTILQANFPRDLQTFPHPDQAYTDVPREIARDGGFQKMLQEIRTRLGARTWKRFPLRDLRRVVIAYLHERYPYSHRLRYSIPKGFDPVLAFINAPKRSRGGSCMFFASTMAMLCRSLGIATRTVGGYTGKIPSGTQWIVAQAHAHAWIEVYCGPENGWVAMDPTPGSSLPETPEGLAGEIQDQIKERNEEVKNPQPEATIEPAPDPFLSTLMKQIGNYDEDSRDELFGSVKGLFQSLGSFFKNVFGWMAKVPIPLWPVIITVLYLLARTMKRAGRSFRLRSLNLNKKQRSAVRVYDEFLRAVRKRGIRRDAPMTARDLLSEVHEKLGEEAYRLAVDITNLFEDIRYGNYEPSEAELEEASAQVKGFQRA